MLVTNKGITGCKVRPFTSPVRHHVILAMCKLYCVVLINYVFLSTVLYLSCVYSCNDLLVCVLVHIMLSTLSNKFSSSYCMLSTVHWFTETVVWLLSIYYFLSITVFIHL